VRSEWRDLDVFESRRKEEVYIYYQCVKSQQGACWEIVMNWNCLPLKNIICLQAAVRAENQETFNRDAITAAASRPSPNQIIQENPQSDQFPAASHT